MKRLTALSSMFQATECHKCKLCFCNSLYKFSVNFDTGIDVAIQ